MRFLTADYLFPLDQKPIKEGVVNVDKSWNNPSSKLNNNKVHIHR